jgi:hypothetical protein
MAWSQERLEDVVAFFAPKVLAGQRVLVSRALWGD